MNRGQILATIVGSSKLTKSEAAIRAGYTRSSYYKHIENPELDYHILMAYGKAIGHDFTEEFPDMPKYVLEESEAAYGQPKTIEEAIQQKEIWKNKYLELLEKYNRLMEEKLGS